MATRSLFIVGALGVTGLLIKKMRDFKNKLDTDRALDQLNKFIEPPPLIMESITVE